VWTARLDRDLENLRAALIWTREQGREDVSLRLVGALATFWSIRGYTREGRTWLESAIVRAESVSVPAAVRAQALYGAGCLANGEGDQARAAQWLEQSIARYREAADPIGTVRALNTLGGVAYDEGDLAGAMARWQECLALSRAANDTGEVARALMNLGEAAWGAAFAAGRALSLDEAIADALA
jgi:tetratricopeptide (TPR) repeat protein